MFKVLEFTDNGLGVVREGWLTPKKKECLWPPVKTTSKFNKCLMSANDPDASWTAYAVKRVMFETNDLQLAQEKCKKAVSDSELQSEQDEQNNKKRKRKIKIYTSESSEEEQDKRINFKYPSPPNLNEKQLQAKEIIRHDLLSLEDFNIDSPLHSPILATQKEVTLDKINASLELIATYIADIQCEVKELKATQNEILLGLSSSSCTVLGKIILPEEIALPLKSIEDLNNIQIWLESEENKQNLINNLSFVGGNTTATITRRILQRVFSTSLALQCNWTGKNNKFSLKKIHLTEVIINAVRRNKLAEKATEAEITNSLTSWFRFARDRDGGRDNRRTKTSP